MSFGTEGMQVPLKTLKRGSVIGYDSILSATCHELNARCFNYYMVDENMSDEFPLIRASKSKFKSGDIEQVNE